jgi:hypothetical protein
VLLALEASCILLYHILSIRVYLDPAQGLFLYTAFVNPVLGVVLVGILLDLALEALVVVAGLRIIQSDRQASV